MLDEREVKKQIKAFERLKRKARVGTAIRRDMNRRIRELKEKLENLYGDITPEKQELMDKIYEAEPNLKRVKVDLRKFTIEELQYHYDTKIKKEE